MKLDHEIVRDILLTVQRDHQRPEWEWVIPNSDFPRFYAADKLREGGFIKATILPGSENDDAISIDDLTYNGHVFLDTIRDPKAWAVVKRIAKGAGGIGAQSIFAVASGELAELVKKIISDI